MPTDILLHMGMVLLVEVLILGNLSGTYYWQEGKWGWQLLSAQTVNASQQDTN